MKKHLINIIFVVMVLGLVFSTVRVATANEISIYPAATVGNWNNAVGGDFLVISNGGVSSVTWGSSFKPPNISSFTFYRNLNLFSAEYGTPIVVGQLVYEKGYVDWNDDIQSVDLDLSMHIEHYLHATLTSTINFSATSWLDTTPMVYFSGSYIDMGLSNFVRFEWLGFSNDNGNNFITRFERPEGSWTIYQLYGQFIEVTGNQAVPEPTTILLLWLGLMGLGGVRRKIQQ